MKIALVRQRYTAFGGAERFVERAIEALGLGDIELTLLTRGWSGQSPGHVHVKKLDPFHVGRTWRDWSFARAVQAEIENGGYDLVQSHERIPGCHLYRAGDGTHRGWLEHRARARGSVFRPSRCGPYHRYTLAAEAAMFRHPRLRLVICNSRFIQREIVATFGLPESKLRLIENGVDLSRFRPAASAERQAARKSLDLPQDVPLLAFVGSGFERKGLDAAIATLPPEAWLVVAGKDRSEARYRRLARKAGCGERVCFLGPRQDVAPVYHAADAFVFPAVYEPFGNVVLEALACGLPTITSRTCGTESLVEPGQNGWLVDAFAYDSLQAALAELMRELADASRWAARRAAARATAERFDLAGMARRMEALYRELLSTS